MPIGISEEHVELAGSVAKWAASVQTIDAVRAAEEDPGTLAGWPRRWAELGLASVALPEPDGGGGTLLDQAVALEAAARGLVPGELLTTVAAGLLVDEETREAIASAQCSFGLGVPPGLEIQRETLRGTVDVVAGTTADRLLLGAGERWFVVPAERCDVTAHPATDLSRGFARVSVDAPLGDVREVDTDSATVRGLLTVLAAAEASGIARWCLDTAVEYAKVREQFGKPIGSFQAIKHLCAQMLETSESVTAAAWDAARAWVAAPGTPGDQQRDIAVAVAGTICLDGAVSVAKDCVQVLGGVGFTFEHDAHLYLRRALALRSLLGPTSRYAADLAALARAGVRRTPEIDLDDVDPDLRAATRAEAERIAALPEAEQRVALADSGYLVPHWPAPYGLGAGPAQGLVVDEELARAGVTPPDLKIGGWAAPTIVVHGTDEQRERFVRPTLTGELVWCQLFSEPGAGSDLASLRTRAVRDETGGGWRLSGQKVWTSLAQEADWAICLARTSTEGKPHAGITYFLVDMSSEGIDIRPLRELTGEAMFNEVFLDDVFVPDECVVGDVDGGWALARTTLANERVAMAGSKLDDSVERALTLYDDPAGQVAVGRAVAWSTVVKLLATRSVLRSLEGRGPGAESSVAKLVGVGSRQDAAELVVEQLGDRALTADPLARDAVHELLLTRCLSIAGGTTQVLRNVAGERILGLPRG